MCRGRRICSIKLAPSTTQSNRGIVMYVLEMRDQLTRYQEEVEVNLGEKPEKPEDLVCPAGIMICRISSLTFLFIVIFIT